jgi:threonine/homoserine/homoserine lactone efflux protein
LFVFPPELFALLQKSYATGWLVAAPIGPVNLEIIRRGLHRSLLSGFLVGLGACCVDLAYFCLFSVGLGSILVLPWVHRTAHLLGGAILCWIAGGALAEARRFGLQARKAIPENGSAPWKNAPPDPPSPKMIPFLHRPLGSYLVGIGMTATNPMTIAFWSALALEFANLPLGWRMAAGASLLGGCMSWVLLLTALLAFARHWVGPRLFMLVTLAGGSVVLYFGLRFLWRGLAAEAWLLARLAE